MILEHTIDMIMTFGAIIASSLRFRKWGNAETRDKKLIGRSIRKNRSSSMVDSSPRVVSHMFFFLEEEGKLKSFISFEPIYLQPRPRMGSRPSTLNPLHKKDSI
jgi:hypothetical protein